MISGEPNGEGRIVGRETQKFACQGSVTCGFIYDPERGDKKGKIPPGVSFKELPLEWRCPCCGARREKFRPLDESKADPLPFEIDSP
jgi:rubredoxin